MVIISFVSTIINYLFSYMLSIKEKQRKEIYKEKKRKEIMKDCHIAKCIKALKRVANMSAIGAGICILTAVMVVPYHMFFLKIALILAVVTLISLIALNYTPTSSES